MYADVPPLSFTPLAPGQLLEIRRFAGMRVAFTKLPPPALRSPLTTSATGPETARVDPPDSVTLRKQYVPSASVAVLPPLTVRSPVAALYVNLPLIPVALLYGEQAATGGASMVGDG